jgi:hypothetical protein
MYLFLPYNWPFGEIKALHRTEELRFALEFGEFLGLVRFIVVYSVLLIFIPLTYFPQHVFTRNIIENKQVAFSLLSNKSYNRYEIHISAVL